MMRLILLFCCFFLSLLSPTFAQQNVAFEATTDRKLVAIGERFQIKFTLKNAKGSQFVPPNFDAFNSGGVSRMFGSSGMNGVWSSTETYIYTLQAKQEGTFNIGVASINAAGKVLKTQPVSIVVTKAQVPSNSADLSKNTSEKVFIRAEVSRHLAYIGQQLTLEYRLYRRVNLNALNLIKESDYAGFFKQPINEFDHTESQVTLGGKRYVVSMLAKVALLGQQSGKFSIEPFTLEVGVLSSGDEADPMIPFFNHAEPMTVRANAVEIEVKDLPQNHQLSSFNGAIGKYTAKWELTPATGNATTDEVLSLKLKLIGNGDAKRSLAPALAPIAGLELYEPKVIQEQSYEQQGEIVTDKTIEYLIAPRKAGNYTINPAFTYFDPEKNDFQTLTTAPLALNITQGSNPIPLLANKDSSTVALRDILPMRTLARLDSARAPFFASFSFWIWSLLPFLFLAFAVAYKRYRTQQAQRDEKDIKSENAKRIAKKRLEKAAEYLQANQARSFYDNLSRTLYGYLGDKLQIAPADFAKSTVAERMAQANIPSANIETLKDLLQRCEMALFANQGNDLATMNDNYQRALQLINDIEQQLKKK